MKILAFAAIFSTFLFATEQSSASSVQPTNSVKNSTLKIQEIKDGFGVFAPNGEISDNKINLKLPDSHYDNNLTLVASKDHPIKRNSVEFDSFKYIKALIALSGNDEISQNRIEIDATGGWDDPKIRINEANIIAGNNVLDNNISFNITSANKINIISANLNEKSNIRGNLVEVKLFRHINELAAILGSGKISQNQIEIDAMGSKNSDSNVSRVNIITGGDVLDNTIRFSSPYSNNLTAISGSGKISQNRIKFSYFNHIKNLTAIVTDGEISQNKLIVDAMGGDDASVNIDEVNLITSRNGNILENNITLERSRIKSIINIASADSANILNNNIEISLLTRIDGDLPIFSAKGDIAGNNINLDSASVAGSAIFARSSGNISANQIQIEEDVLVDGHIVAAIADGEISDNNITINKLNRPYSHSGITTGFKFSGRKSGIAAGRSGKNATNNIISIKDCLVNGDVSGFNAPNGEINATLFSIEYSKIKGNVILGRAKSIKNSTLSLSTSEILGTIEGGGADSTLNIQAAAIFAKDIKNFGRLNFILTDKSERNNEFLVLRNSESLDLRGVKITLKIDEYDRPSIRKDDHIVLINSRKPIIIDENTKLQTIDIGKQGYEFKLQARGGELLAIATASPYKEYRRRRLFWWRLLFR